MIRFHIPRDSTGVASIDLGGAYLVGADGVPVRAEIEFDGDYVCCNKRAAGPAGLSLMHHVPGVGSLMLETGRLMDRDRPYVLALELLRGRLMRISHKREDWGLFDYPGGDDLYQRVDAAKTGFVASLTAADERSAHERAEEALVQAVSVGEDLSLFHANVFLERRKAGNQLGQRLFGCGVSLQHREEAYLSRLAEAFDFVVLPIHWRTIEPRQGAQAWDLIDPWLAWAGRQKLPVRASPLVSFHKSHLPDWVSLYDADFDTVRDLVTAHVKRTLSRLAPYVAMWDVTSGLHAYNTCNLTLDQIMEITRLCAALVKQMAPRATVVVDLVAPWGEYYARNPRSVPPMLFADMLVTSGIPLDAFGLQFFFGCPQDGYYVRDMLQISAMIDRFSNFGKPLHISAVQVPSAHTRDSGDHWNGAHDPMRAGFWRKPWTEPQQAEWLLRFHQVALSKPFVETVAWRDLADVEGHFLPHGGLLRGDLSPKPSYETLLQFRNSLPGRAAKARAKK